MGSRAGVKRLEKEGVSSEHGFKGGFKGWVQGFG